MNKLILLLYIATTVLYAANPQARPGAQPREIKAGEVVALDSGLSVKVTRSATSPFTGVKLKGDPVVVVVELDAGKNPLTFLYALNSVPKSAEIYLASGAQKLTPRAVIEDFPSFGADNDKEIEEVDPKGGASPSTLEFDGKGSIMLLFDVPPSQAKSAKKFSVVIHTIKPRAEQYSLVVGM